MNVHPNGVYEWNGQAVLCVVGHRDAVLGPVYYNLLFVRLDPPEESGCCVVLSRICRLDPKKAEFIVEEKMKFLADCPADFFKKCPEGLPKEDDATFIDGL